MSSAETNLLVKGWRIWEYPVVDSTNLVAAKLPAWSAVRADTQTAGRGRFQRKWVSDLHGLWLSAVVPTSGAMPLLPLIAGLAVADALRAVGVEEMRMRWPNDLLVDNRKLAGLLVDQFTPGLAVIGIGVNVGNHPERLDATLIDQTTRLAELVAAAPDIRDLMDLILGNLRRAITRLQAGESASLLTEIGQLWGPPRPVTLDLDGTKATGLFRGVDEHGRLILNDELGPATMYAPHQVRHLTEMELP
jgi:BirA family transcriptional regulator, biotin operon repressor / biotin---[acetyl-CoA-carboxylase] ligase